jgi:hypothetical protein
MLFVTRVDYDVLSADVKWVTLTMVQCNAKGDRSYMT